MSSVPVIGVRVHGGDTPQNCIDVAVAAERNGFASIWFAENAFDRGVLPAVAGAVVSTSSIKVGIGVFNPYNRHPTLIAMEIGALDELAKGRAALGIGSGIGDRVVSMGLSYDKPLGAVRDAINIVRGMLNGEAVTYEGAVFSVKNAKLGYVPPRPKMPIYMAAMGEQAIRLCGQVADGLMISNLCPPGFAVRAQKLMQEGAEKAGRPRPSDIVQYVLCSVGSDRAEARAKARRAIAGMLPPYWGLGERAPAVRDAMLISSGITPEECGAVVAQLKAGGDPQTLLDDRFVDAYALAGTPDECVEGAARFGAAGVGELVVTMVGGNPHAEMALLGPALRATA